MSPQHTIAHCAPPVSPSSSPTCGILFTCLRTWLHLRCHSNSAHAQALPNPLPTSLVWQQHTPSLVLPTPFYSDRDTSELRAQHKARSRLSGNGS